MNVILSLTLFAQSVGGTAAVQQVDLLAPDVTANDRFGYSVAFDDTTVAIGAIGDDDAGADSGSVRVYLRVGLNWTLQAKLVPTDLREGDWFGYSCALSGDTLAVGAKRADDVGGNAGAVYVFERSGGVWHQTAKLYASDPGPGALFGHDLALEGDRMVVGAWGDDALGSRSGAAYVFRRVGSMGDDWIEDAKLTASDGMPLDDFGRAVAIEETRIVVGKPGDRTNGENAGAAYVFDLIGSGWVEVAKLLPLDGDESDNFGGSVSLSRDTVVIGSPADDDAGASSGAAYVFQRDDGLWFQTSKLLPADGRPGAQFGTSVGIQRDRILVGASNDSAAVSGGGAIYEFIRGPESWLEVNKFAAEGSEQMDSFGWDLDLGERRFVTGAQNRDELGDNSGVAYLYELRDLFVAHCQGDGGNQVGCTNCPCGNEAFPGAPGGCLNSTSRGAELVASGIPFISMDSMRVEMRGAPSGSFAVLLSAITSLPLTASHPCFGLSSGVQSSTIDGLRCIGGQLMRHGARATDFEGDIGVETSGWGGVDAPLAGILHQGGFVAGQKREFQIFYRDASDQICQRALNTTNAMSVTFGP